LAACLIIKTVNVVIAGGGIGGLSAALFPSAEAIDVDVSELQELGVGNTLPGRGLCKHRKPEKAQT
jgi:flavin-dependent dehydrogenase